MPVQVIEAIPQYSTAPDAPPRKLRACAYARISLDEDGNNGSIANQIAYFTDYLENNPDFSETHVYYDDGISGTSTRNRHGFNQMMRDVEADMWDVIYTKSISRYSRNILVTLSSLKTCEDHNCRVFFQKESLWSDDPQTTLLLRILSSLAEAESSSIAANVQLGIRFAFQQGKPMINCNHFLGYDKDPITHKLVINPSEAHTVRYIFRAFLEGFTPHEIAKRLREAGVPSGAGRCVWPVDSIRYILSNEKYVGDLLMQKTYCKSFLTHRVVKNDGKLPQYFVEDNHDPVVPRTVFNLTQSEIVRRGREVGHPGQRKYPLSGKVICGCCGSEYKRFAGARLMPTVPAALALPAASDDPATEANTLPAVALPAPDTSYPAAPGEMECAGNGGAAETVAASTSGKDGVAVWKCKARFSKKDAASAYARLFPDRVMADADAHSAGQGGDAAAAPRVDDRVEPAAHQDGLTWRCNGAIIDEHTLQMAVDRALALLPREIDNIKLIREECLRVSTPSSSAGVNANRGEGEQSGQESGQDGEAERRASAQLLLLHIDTALSFLHGNSSSSGAGAGSGGAGAGSSRDALPCTTFQQFVERSASIPPAVESNDGGSGSGGNAEAIDLLIEKVVIDGEKIRVVFKAGVEV